MDIHEEYFRFHGLQIFFKISWFLIENIFHYTIIIFRKKYHFQKKLNPLNNKSISYISVKCFWVYFIYQIHFKDFDMFPKYIMKFIISINPKMSAPSNMKYWTMVTIILIYYNMFRPSNTYKVNMLLYATLRPWQHS